MPDKRLFVDRYPETLFLFPSGLVSHPRKQVINSVLDFQVSLDTLHTSNLGVDFGYFECSHFTLYVTVNIFILVNNGYSLF